MRLTRRQKDVLRELAARGGTNEQIGAALYISPYTVKRHIAAILRQLRVRSRAEAAQKGIELLDAEAPQKTTVSLSSLAYAHRRIAGMVAAGFSNDQIAAQTGLSVEGVKSRLKTLYKKLGVSGGSARTRLAILYKRQTSN